MTAKRALESADVVATRAEAVAGVPEPLIILDGLEPFVPGHGDITARRLGAGHSNETFLVERDGVPYVLRRPPRPPWPPSAHDVGREFRVLSALAGADLPVPRTVMMCVDPEPIGAPFYLMEHIDGAVVRDTFPSSYAAPADRHEAILELARTLARIHEVDWKACGLADLSRPSGYLDRQLTRWGSQWERHATRAVPEVDALGAWLRDNRPPTEEVTLVHGDYKLDNVVLTASPPGRILAILDWEMSALGDPMADVGLLSASYVEPGHAADPVLGFSPASTAAGCPTRAEMVEAYAASSSRSMEHLQWYERLAIWKIIIILEGGYRRYLAGTTGDPFFTLVEEGVPRLAAQALAQAGA